MATGLCRHDAYEIVVAQLEGTEYAVDVCDDPATHRVIVRRAGDGLTVEVAVEVCEGHADLLGEVVGFERAIKLRGRS